MGACHGATVVRGNITKNNNMRKTLHSGLVMALLCLFGLLSAGAMAQTATAPTHFTGTFTDQKGRPVAGVVVSNGFTCVRTDARGQYRLPYNSASKFVYYTVPADCEVPVHSATDNTAYFYQQVTDGKLQYDFSLTKLAGGKEKNYKLIIIGDPQATNAYGPYFQGPNDNAVRKSDVERFTEETMADIKKTIAALPEDTPVYGISMGDDVQYYGGYNEKLEGQVRAALGSSRMRLFSVIGNHDQDGKALYKQKWEEAWGPTDYSFDRGNVHYVCFNNVIYYRGWAYYQPGELTDEQMAWLESDLSLVPKNKLVVLNYHIPLTFGNRTKTPNPNSIGDGHYASNRLERLMDLLGQFKGYELFCGHTHFAVNNEIDFHGRHILEHCHAAACGDIWQSNINIDGVPNGYYVYTVKGNAIKDCYYKGTRWDRSKQMALFRADTDFNGENYADDWNLPKGHGVLVANVFNADSQWNLYAIENGVKTPMTRLQKTPNQDAFAVGYHHKYVKSNPYSFFSKRNGYLKMNHWYYYKPRDPKAHVTIVAKDRYGNTYTESSDHVITEPFYNYAHYYVDD